MSLISLEYLPLETFERIFFSLSWTLYSEKIRTEIFQRDSPKIIAQTSKKEQYRDISSLRLVSINCSRFVLVCERQFRRLPVYVVIGLGLQICADRYPLLERLPSFISSAQTQTQKRYTNLLYMHINSSINNHNLCYFTRLETLKITHSKNMTPNNLSFLTRLRHLYIKDFTPMTLNYFFILKNLPELELLVIERGHGFDIEWESLPKLRKLSLGNCELMEPSKMSLLTNLEVLSLRGQNFITENHLTNMKKLTHLDLVCNHKISQSIRYSLPNLRVIGLGTGCSISTMSLIKNPSGIELIDYGENGQPHEPRPLIENDYSEEAVPLKYCRGLFKYIFEEPFR